MLVVAAGTSGLGTLISELRRMQATTAVIDCDRHTDALYTLHHSLRYQAHAPI